jgi:hypothetical protein
MPLTREEILGAIRRTAAENGGRPLGRDRLEQLTGITQYEIERYWRGFGDAQREAGFQPNTLNAAYDDDFLIERYVGLTRALGHVPTRADMRIAREESDQEFPNFKVYERFGSKAELLTRIVAYCKDRSDNADVLAIIELEHTAVPHDAAFETSAPLTDEAARVGFVYLVQGHRGEFKIGRTNLVDRRLSELGTTAAVEQTLIHEIKTDDPVGVESYWHTRFADKRMRGEWFKLAATDVRAFKRWKRIY